MASTPLSALVEHALSLITLAQIEAPEKAREIRSSLDRWRSQSDEHARAYLEAVRQSGVLEAMGPELRERFGKPVKRRAAIVRTRVLSFAFVAIAVAALAAGLLDWRNRQPVFHERLVTGPAQVASLDLPDGGRIELGARTTLEVTYFQDRRSVEFGHGEARFEVAPDPSRQFSVQTREGRVEVVGTIFDVTDRGGPLSVALERGKVRFAPSGAGSAPIDMQPGQKLSMKDGIVRALRTVPADGMASWRRGWLVFEDAPLSEALPEINAYRKQPIVVDDPAVMQLRLTGSFRIAESGNLLVVLPQILPLTVLEDAGGAPRLVLRR